MNTQEAAKHIGRSVATLRRDQRLRHLGIKFKQKMVGRKEIVYEKKDLDRWMKSILVASKQNF